MNVDVIEAKLEELTTDIDCPVCINYRFGEWVADIIDRSDDKPIQYIGIGRNLNDAIDDLYNKLGWEIMEDNRDE